MPSVEFHDLLSRVYVPDRGEFLFSSCDEVVIRTISPVQAL